MAQNAIDWLTRRWRRGALHDKPLPVIGQSLHDGDVIEATVATDDGAINLGVQRNVVVYK